MKHNSPLFGVAVLLCLAMVCGCARNDAPDGAVLAEAKGCIACHGPDGVATAPAYPNLAGQWERYLRLQLLAYRAGRRENAIMAGFAGALSDAEIRALAKHYAGN